MKYIDMHCDTLMTLFYEDPIKAELNKSAVTMVDFERMKKGNALAQFFAIFVIPRDRYYMHHIDSITDEQYIQKTYEYFVKNMEEHSDIIAPAYNYQNIMDNQSIGKMSGILTMEDGRTVNGNLENIEKYYKMGFRALGLTWNLENCFGAPNSKNPEIMNKGLTPFGKEAVEYMQEIGMLVDVSHLSDGGFYDVAEICKKPFAATHSNCRELSPHQRNLTDDMLKVLASAGGVAGINFGPEFLNIDITNINSSVERMVAMAQHMKQIGGIEVIGIGSDFDGIEGNLEIGDSGQMHVLADALSIGGFTSREVELILSDNVLRVIKDTMK